jgi:hypothetical protein
MNAIAPSKRTNQRMKVVSAAILASLLALVASHAEADVAGKLQLGLEGWPFSGGGFPDPTKGETNPIGVEYGTKTMSELPSVGTVSIEGNLRLGTLRASAIAAWLSNAPLPGGSGGHVSSEISMSDTVTFNNVQPGQDALLDSVVGGHFTQDPQTLIDRSSPGIASATHTVLVTDLAHPFSPVLLSEYFLPSPMSPFSSCEDSPASECIIGNNSSVARTLRFPLSNGTYTFIWHLTLEAFAGASADFGNTALAYLRLPDGVTFTSESGAFLAEAVPLVPEPSVALSTTTALCWLVVMAMARRKRIVRSSGHSTSG